MDKPFADIVGADQARIATELARAERVETLLKNFCKAVAVAAESKDENRGPVVCVAGHPDPENPGERRWNIVNHYDDVIKMVSSTSGISRWASRRDVAVYTVSLQKDTRGFLARTFGSSAASPGISVGKGYRHPYGGVGLLPEFSRIKGCKAAPLTDSGDFSAHGPLQKMMADIYQSMPAEARQKFDLSALKP